MQTEKFQDKKEERMKPFIAMFAGLKTGVLAMLNTQITWCSVATAWYCQLCIVAPCMSCNKVDTVEMAPTLHCSTYKCKIRLEIPVSETIPTLSVFYVGTTTQCWRRFEHGQRVATCAGHNSTSHAAVISFWARVSPCAELKTI